MLFTNIISLVSLLPALALKARATNYVGDVGSTTPPAAGGGCEIYWLFCPAADELPWDAGTINPVWSNNAQPWSQFLSLCEDGLDEENPDGSFMYTSDLWSGNSPTPMLTNAGFAIEPCASLQVVKYGYLFDPYQAGGGTSLPTPLTDLATAGSVLGALTCTAISGDLSDQIAAAATTTDSAWGANNDAYMVVPNPYCNTLIEVADGFNVPYFFAA